MALTELAKCDLSSLCLYTRESLILQSELHDLEGLVINDRQDLIIWDLALSPFSDGG